MTEKQKPSEPSRSAFTIKAALLLMLMILPAAIPFAAGKYMELLRDGPFDGALNAYAAKAVLDGARIGPDILPSARPATLLVNIAGVAVFGYSELGPKLIQMAMQLAALVFLFITMRKLFGKIPATVSLFLAAFFLSYPLFAKYGNVKEQFMIASALIAACSLLLASVDHKAWLLILAGAAAINVHYFKPTGDSVWVAMVIYLIARLCMDRDYHFRQLAKQIGLLLLGALIGITPLLILFGSQDHLSALTTELPKPATLKKTFGTSSQPSAVPAESQSKNQPAAPAQPDSYLEASRQVSDFASQYEWVMQYYSSLVVPIGLALAAIACFIAARFRRSLSSDPNQPNAPPITPRHRLAVELMLAIWWLLDMLFVWVSPRSYVEYFLPLNASAAALAAVFLYHSRRYRFAMPILAFAWAAVYLFTNCLNPAAAFPYLTWITPNPLTTQAAIFYLLAALLLCVPIFIKKVSRHPAGVFYFQLVVAAGIFLVWLTPLIREFSVRVSDLHRLRIQSKQQARQLSVRSTAALSPLMRTWTQAQIAALQEGQPHTWKFVGHFINLDSTPNDTIYVWGWFPGIYLTAQRLAPVNTPSESDMHTKPPSSLAGQINGLVAKFQQNPPKFIIDSQKMHFPYYSHPLFDLWPRLVIKNNKPVGFDLRVMPSADNKNIQLIPPQELQQLLPNLIDNVRQMTYALLTSPKRKGGPLPENEARQKADLEAQRHQAMQPLREFVMRHYRLVPIPGVEMFIFQYQPDNAVQ